MSKKFESALDAVVQRCMEPGISLEELNRRLEQGVRVVSQINVQRESREDARWNSRVAQASNAGDLQALRKLANANLSKRR